MRIMSLPLSLIYFMMPSTNHHLKKTPAELAEGAQQNELQYTKEVHNMMKNPKERHLRDELNRKKICYFIDKYVTRFMDPDISHGGLPRTRTKPYLIWSQCQIWHTRLR